MNIPTQLRVPCGVRGSAARPLVQTAPVAPRCRPQRSQLARVSAASEARAAGSSEEGPGEAVQRPGIADTLLHLDALLGVEQQLAKQQQQLEADAAAAVAAAEAAAAEAAPPHVSVPCAPNACLLPCRMPQRADRPRFPSACWTDLGTSYATLPCSGPSCRPTSGAAGRLWGGATASCRSATWRWRQRLPTLSASSTTCGSG